LAAKGNRPGDDGQMDPADEELARQHGQTLGAMALF